MSKLGILKSALIGGASAIVLATGAYADEFNVPGGDLRAALNVYAKQARVALIVSADVVKGVQTKGVQGDLPAEAALLRILDGTGLVTHHHSSGAVTIVRDVSPAQHSELVQPDELRLASATTAAAGIESVVVTSSKIKGDIQTVPIAITALSQEQLTSRQIAGGPDLVKEVPNLTFSKTNFTGYNIQIRGIGTQAISVTTDPAVAVALNDMPFIRNHFFEQEFYDVNQVEVLRGPQGTLYGRNATAGVVNVVTAKPTDQFEAMASADIGNYHNRRFEGMINIPVVDDRLDIRAAGEWTKRDGYSFNQITNSPIDGRDLWSGRISISLKPLEDLQTTLVWEHFSENDDRMRTSKQLCKTAPIPYAIDGVTVPRDLISVGGAYDAGAYLSQGCLPTGLYSADAFEVPNGYSLPYVTAGRFAGVIDPSLDVYASTTQSRNLRVIESTINPSYKARNDVVEFNADYQVTPSLTFTSQSGYNNDFLWSTEDYNRFNTASGIFLDSWDTPGGVFCDPQLGCASRVIAQDLSDENAWQASQEFRLASNFSGPLNFSVGGNFTHYETEENYYVFINTLTAYALDSFGQSSFPYVPGVSDNHECLKLFHYGYTPLDPRKHTSAPSQNQCNYIDPNPISHLNNEGHNYFLSQNPYVLNSYAGFGEAYYQMAPDLKLTGGLRWTDDRKHFTDIPSEVITDGWGYATTGIVDQQWKQWTGRAAANWTPKFDFTDQTLIYGSFARGYKAGGANPPGAALLAGGRPGYTLPIHPLTFKPEFINAYELGTKNTLLDGALTLNGDVFYYDYKAYQISEIVDRTSINLNFDATVHGAEFEATFEPAPGLKFNFAGGYESTRLANGSQAIDLIDRTDSANHPDWIVVKPFVAQASNCIAPANVIAGVMQNGAGWGGFFISDFCALAYIDHIDPVTGQRYVKDPTVYGGCESAACFGPIPTGYPGFDPTQPAINNGEGFDKDLSGNQLPNAPHFTTSLSGDYTLPVSEDWAATLHSDFYWQSQSFARVENDRPYDKIRGYSTTNLALILTSASGWQVMGYLKNVFNVTAITGDFLNSDDTGLTTNVFLTDPRLYGVRVTKNF